ncbi:MAG: hypothetical protein M1541_14480 [Acidobacteria bacterium]|nr:hypothetical protein [Acidobacteriota bacterium]
MTITQTEILQHALVGYQARREEIIRRIHDLEQQLNGAQASVAPAKPKQRLSAAGRQRIAAATKKRWRQAKRAGRRTLE